MNERPESIKVICWFLIVTAGISLVSGTLSFNNPLAQELLAKSPIPASIQYIMFYAGLFVTLVCATAMLKGQNWARFLYIGWSITGFVIGIATSPVKVLMIPGLVIFLTVAFFLFRPKANEYFKATDAA